MSKKRLVYAAVFCILIGFPLNAATVSFLVIETGLPQQVPVNHYSAMWENGLMDVFFEQGYIVSNAPMMRLYEKPEPGLPSDAEKELDVAKEGGVEFFIIAIVDYPPPKGQEVLKPQKVSLRLFRVNSSKMLHEQQYMDKTSRSQKEEYDNLKKAVMALIPHLKDK
ncbi:MAG: hypothetical protein LBD48_13935 [Treponema sp.]|jgi:hypothetical protein|nr:hypothetical protein [Treponema sp.]